MLDISIIIVNYKVKKYIIPCIESIYKHQPTNYSFEIIIVDNNSMDGTIEKICNDFPEVKIIKNDENMGFSFAVNQGAKAAAGENIFILNPDTLFIEDSLSKLMLFLLEQNNSTIIGPSLVSESGKIQQSFWRKPSLINTIYSIYHLDYLNYKKNYKDIKIKSKIEVDCISGAAIITKTEIFKSLNGLNENLFWMEDIDFCIRAKKVGCKIFYFKETKIVHHQGKSAEKNYRITISNQLLSKIKFFELHHSNLKTIILKLLILILSIIKGSIFLIISPFGRVYKNKMLGYSIAIHSILFHLYKSK